MIRCQLVVGQRRTARQAEAPLEDAGADRPPTTRRSAKTGWRWSGFHVGRDSMSSASSARRIVSRSAPNRSGSIGMHVSQ